MKSFKFPKRLLFPPRPLMILLIPIATVFLILSMVKLGSESPVSIVSYVLAAYTLTVWCMKIPDIIRFFKNFKKSNKYARLWAQNEHLRAMTTLYGSLIFNAIFAFFQLGLGIYHKSFWFYSLAGYYIMLAALRAYLVYHASKKGVENNFSRELLRYRACGIVFLLMNLSLSAIMIFMIKYDRTFIHHEITTIAIAAYTFTALTAAIVGTVRYRKYNSPVYSASKTVSLAAASVSILTLEATMLTSFGKETTTELTRKIFLSVSGAAVSVFITAMAIYMIVTATKQLKGQKETAYIKELKEKDFKYESEK